MPWTMPPETAPQERVWMAFPRAGQTLGDDPASADRARAAWAEVARAIARFEPVTMLVAPEERASAERLLGDVEGVTLEEGEVHEYWMRDVGPTFVLDEDGILGAVDWTFNGWGAHEWAEWQGDDVVAGDIAERADAVRIATPLVLEGGAFHVDGEGTLYTTETVVRDPRRNPYLSRERAELELRRLLGVERVVWLSRGLERDYGEFGTSGHVDIVAAVPSPGVVLLHWQDDPAHPDYAVCRALRAELEAAVDARGRTPRVIELPAPGILEDEEGPVDYSYVNHLVVNGGVIACAFGDAAADARAKEILERAYPGREVVTVDAIELFARGGGIHCITQQQPSEPDDDDDERDEPSSEAEPGEAAATDADADAIDGELLGESPGGAA